MKLTDAERRALEWLRDGDEQGAGVDPNVVDALAHRGLIMTVLADPVGQLSLGDYMVTDRGHEALASTAAA
jgi:hypothetical protein